MGKKTCHGNVYTILVLFRQNEMVRHNLFYDKQSNRLVIFILVLSSGTKVAHVNVT